MRKINQKLGTTFIFSTHDQRVIDMADRLVRVEDGILQELGIRRGDNWLKVRIHHPGEELARADTGPRARLGEAAAAGGVGGAPEATQ
jgi:ABC-type glutathione transport system ATPase component